MFEAEVEMERRSTILPLLLMMCLAAALLGLVVYVVMQVRERRPLSAEQAGPVVAAAVQAHGPAVIHFHTGLVKPSNDDKASEPNYRLLEKAGIVKLGKAGKGGTQVTLTPTGEQLLAGIPEFKKSQETDGTFLYQAPVAHRQFVSVASVEMSGTDAATVAYNWKWVSNPLGDVFDAGGSLVKSFNLWERQNLINKYGADFYHADQTRSAIVLSRDGRNWKIATR